MGVGAGNVDVDDGDAWVVEDGFEHMVKAVAA